MRAQPEVESFVLPNSRVASNLLYCRVRPHIQNNIHNTDNMHRQTNTHTQSLITWRREFRAARARSQEITNSIELAYDSLSLCRDVCVDPPAMFAWLMYMCTWFCAYLFYSYLIAAQKRVQSSGVHFEYHLHSRTAVGRRVLSCLLLFICLEHTHVQM